MIDSLKCIQLFGEQRNTRRCIVRDFYFYNPQMKKMFGSTNCYFANHQKVMCSAGIAYSYRPSKLRSYNQTNSRNTDNTPIHTLIVSSDNYPRLKDKGLQRNFIRECRVYIQTNSGIPDYLENRILALFNFSMTYRISMPDN